MPSPMPPHFNFYPLPGNNITRSRTACVTCAEGPVFVTDSPSSTAFKVTKKLPTDSKHVCFQRLKITLLTRKWPSSPRTLTQLTQNCRVYPDYRSKLCFCTEIALQLRNDAREEPERQQIFACGLLK